MFYALLAFSLAVICVIRCSPLVNLKTSDNSQNTSTILETLNTIDDLNIIQSMCSIDEQEPGTYYNTYYCQWLMKEKDNYLSLKEVIDIKINEIRSNLLTLLNFENKAIVCRSIRHLLPIIIYGIFINNLNGSTENENSRMNMINELFKTNLDVLNNKNSSIEEKLQQIKTPMKKMDRSGTNKKLLGEKLEQNKGDTSSSILEKIKTTVQLILPFIRELDCFHNLYKIDKAMTTNEFDRNLLLLLVFDEVKEMYRTECYVEVDATTVLQNEDRKWIIESNYDSTSLLVEEIDRISVAIQKDLQFLLIKYFFVNDPKRLLWKSHDISLVFYHTFNKYYDPYIWRLIGDETIVHYASDFAKPIMTSIDKVASDLMKKIKGITDLLTVFVDNKVGCRCWAYLNVIIKLSYCSIRVLAANVWKVREWAGNIKEMLMFEKLQKTEQNRTYISLHDKINKLEITECFIDDDVSMIDELLDRDDVRKYFVSTYAIYRNRNAQSIAKAIESIWNYTLSSGFTMEFSSILQEIHQIQVHPESDMKFVKYLVKWYKWGKQAHMDRCRLDGFYDDLSTFSDTMKCALDVMSDNTKTTLTLNWIMAMIDTLNVELVDDLTIIRLEFYNE